MLRLPIVLLLLPLIASAALPESTLQEFTVPRETGAVRVSVRTPGRLADRPLLLLFFSTDRAASLPDGRYGGPGRLFLERGHRVASFDLPAHGERVDRHGSGIAGLAARLAAGRDPWPEFLADGRAVVDECLRLGLGEAGRIVVAGVSRGGYAALRLAAEDHRIAAVAAFSPVTDWRELAEFAATADRPETAAADLAHFADRLAGRRVYVAIGNRDTRVGTDACLRFAQAMVAEERRRATSRSALRLLVVDDSPGHTLAPRWREDGVRFLLGPDPADATGRLP
jgi:dienelactone hydrolase